ncbi:putative bifunctional diguanylate cyclase/phosphodiesterase [Klebsiella aerogenes]
MQEKIATNKNFPSFTPDISNQFGPDIDVKYWPERDPVTGVLTREGLLNDKTLYEGRNILSIVQVSNFDNVLYALGREFSDRLIVSFLTQACQIMPPDTLFCRYSSDTIIIVPPGIYDMRDCDIHNELLLKLFYNDADNVKINHNYTAFNGNIGTINRLIHQSSVLDTIQKAGVALSFSKLRTGTNLAKFNEHMLEKELRNIQLHEGFNKAIAKEEFSLVIQPIVELKNPEISNEGECLIRWSHETLGAISPEEFVPLAEETGFIIHLGKWVIEHACLELRNLIHQGLSPDFKLHINVSAIQLIQSSFCRHLLGAIKKNGLVNENICIEITESQLLQDIESALTTLHYLRQHGITVALDDFGTGFSSLSYLHKLPFDCIKIDRNFIKDMLNDRNNMSVIESVLFLAKRFEVVVVAEGIEDLVTGKALQDLRCQKAQGYFYCKPTPFKELAVKNGKIILPAPT